MGDPSKRIQQLTSGKAETDDLLAELIDLGATNILQEGLEAEVDEFLGRGWHEHSGETEPKGYRNGYTPKRFKTRSGGICTYNAPACGTTSNPLSQPFWKNLTTLSNA